MRESHPAQHVSCLGKLNVVVADNLDAVAPRVEEIEEWSGQRFDPGGGQGLAHGVGVINDQARVDPRPQPAYGPSGAPRIDPPDR